MDPKQNALFNFCKLSPPNSISYTFERVEPQLEIIPLIFYLTLLTELAFINESKGRTVTLTTSIVCGKVWSGPWLFLESIINKGVSASVGVGVGKLGETLYASYLFSFIADSESFTVTEAYYLQETETDCSFATAFA